jgi:hypothetical protein
MPNNITRRSCNRKQRGKQKQKSHHLRKEPGGPFFSFRLVTTRP